MSAARLSSKTASRPNLTSLVSLRDFFYEAFEANRSITRASTSSLVAALQSVIGVLRGPQAPSMNSRAPIPGRPSGQDPKSQTTGFPLGQPTANTVEGESPSGNSAFSISTHIQPRLGLNDNGVKPWKW